MPLAHRTMVPVVGRSLARGWRRRLSLAREDTPPPPNFISEAEQRRHAAAAHMLSYHYGFDELLWNHISARLDEAGNFLVTPGDRHFDEIFPEDLIISSPANANVTADVIHSMIYQARPDVGAIVHHHTPAVVAVAALADGLQFSTQDSAAFYGRVAHHEWEGISDDHGECERIAAAVVDSGAHTVLLRNHGALTFGATVAEAWVRYYYLDRVCKVQCAIGAQPVARPNVALLEKTAKQYDGAFRPGETEWPSLLRLAERLQAASRRGELIPGRAA
jgi:ribulose-5-phosphate 4-epimerase/fuculose-1-phosphate aldolase